IPLARHLLTAGSRAPRARGMIRRLGRGGVARASALGGMRDAPKQLTPTRLRDGASRVATTAEEILPSDAWVLVLVATLLDQSGVLMGRRGHKRRLDIERRPYDNKRTALACRSSYASSTVCLCGAGKLWSARLACLVYRPHSILLATSV